MGFQNYLNLIILSYIGALCCQVIKICLLHIVSILLINKGLYYWRLLYSTLLFTSVGLDLCLDVLPSRQ